MIAIHRSSQHVATTDLDSVFSFPQGIEMLSLGSFKIGAILLVHNQSCSHLIIYYLTISLSLYLTI